MALLAAGRGDHASAARLYARAVGQARTCMPVLVEATDELPAAGRPAACLAMIDVAPEEIALHGQVVLQRVRALLSDGQGDAVRALLEAGIELPDLWEVATLGALWHGAFGDRRLRTITTSECVRTSTAEVAVEAGDFQRFGQRGITVVACLVCRRADPFYRVRQLN